MPEAKMRLLFVLSDLEIGGAQRVILTLLRFLNRDRFDIHLAVVQAGGALRSEIPADISLHDLEARRVRYALPALLRLCRALQPDRILSTLSHLNIALLLLRPFLPRGAKLFIREANTASIRLQHTRSPFVYTMAYRILYPLADLIFANSEAMKSDLVKCMKTPAVKIAVTGNPVDIQKIRAQAAGPNPYSASRRQLVAVGRLTRQKGFDLLLQAVSHGLVGRNDWHLTVIGDGFEKEALEKMIADLGLEGRVSLIGQKENPYPYLANADLCVSSSRWEGLPNVVLESLTCGTRVVAFDCPGGTCEIIEEGKNGWLVPAGDWQTLGARIAQVLALADHGWPDTQEPLLPKKYECETVVRVFESHF